MTDYGSDTVDPTSYVFGGCSAQLGLSQIGFRAIGYRRCGAAGRRYFAFDRSALKVPANMKATQGTGFIPEVTRNSSSKPDLTLLIGPNRRK